MKITQFKKMLATYGADASRWDDCDIESVKQLIRDSAEARALYDEAQRLDDALDCFKAGDVDQLVLERVMQRIDGGSTVGMARDGDDTVLSATRFPPIPSEIPDAAVIAGSRQQLYRVAALSCIAALLAFFVAFDGGGADRASSGNGSTALVQNTAVPVSVQEDVDVLLADMGDMVAEEITAHEIIGLLALAKTEAAVTAYPDNEKTSEQDIDVFLDQLFMDMEANPDDDSQLWNLFIESEIREL